LMVYIHNNDEPRLCSPYESIGKQRLIRKPSHTYTLEFLRFRCKNLSAAKVQNTPQNWIHHARVLKFGYTEFTFVERWHASCSPGTAISAVMSRLANVLENTSSFCGWILPHRDIAIKQFKQF
jgi:hypothetical protein